MGTADIDVAVIGLGTMGSMALWQLSRRPELRVAGFEQYGIGHPYGAYAGESRLFRLAYHEGSAYVPMLLRARELWQELNEVTGHEVFAPVGTLSVGGRETAPLRNVLASVTRHRLPHEVLGPEEMRARYPQYRIGDDDIAVLDTGGGALRPELAVIDAVALATANGAQVHERETIAAIKVGEDGLVHITTAQRTVTARTAIVTAGPWAARLVPPLRTKTEIQQILLTWFFPGDGETLDAFSPDTFPTFIRDEGDIHMFGAPSVDGYTIKLSPGRVLPPAKDADALDLRVPPELLTEIGRRAQLFFPGIHPEPVRYSVHPDLFAAGKVPILDVSDDGHVIVATAFSGHGFKFAPVIGEILAALATEGTHPLYDAEVFGIAAHDDI